jgi:type IV secretion system protein VirB9
MPIATKRRSQSFMKQATERTWRADEVRAFPSRPRAFSAARSAARCAVLLGFLIPRVTFAESPAPPVQPAAHAKKISPTRVRATARVRTVVYQDAQVIPLVVYSFRVALIEFAPDEQVETVRVGDMEAWETSSNDVGNRLFVKARLEGVRSNLIVVTDRRTYTFDLESRKETDRLEETTYHVRFVYPDEERAREAVRKQREEERQHALVASGRTMDPGRMNFRYGFAGERKLVPELLFDDGEFTYFKFTSVKDLPAIFVVDEAKQESLANYRVEGEYVIVHRVAGQYSIRQGQRLACIFNEQKDEKRSPGVNGPHERVAQEPSR